MTGKHQPDQPEMERLDEPDKGFVDRRDLRAEEKPTEPPKLVKLTGPSGAKVETSEENAETLRGQGFS